MTTNKEKYKKLTNNKSFCIAPWTHLHSLPTGKIMPCCFWHQSDSDNDYGNVNKGSLNYLLNHDNFKLLRKKFLNGEQHQGCVKCYLHEENNNNYGSMRQWFNKTFDDEELIKTVLNTKEDGRIDDPIIRYLDIRFGNICNLKCRMCGHALSSTWYEEIKIMEEANQKTYDQKKFIHTNSYEKIEPLLPYVQQIYFAGGEPFLYPEHLKILDKLIELKKTDVVLRYNTNLTTLSYKGRYIPDVWKNFNNVHIGASIDATGSVVEYIRTGIKWDSFVENFDKLKNENHVNLFPAPTIGILNIEDYIELSKFIVINKWSDHAPFNPNFVAWPEEQNPCILPDWYKEELIEKYQNHLDWLNNYKSAGAMHQKGGIINIINYIKTLSVPKEKHEDLLITLWERLWVFNKSANLDWVTSLPKLWEFYKKHAEKSDRWVLINGTPAIKKD